MAFFAELKSFSLLCELLIKSSLVLSAALLLVFFLKHKTAALRHFVLSFALICLLLFPLLSTLPTGWETSLLPSWSIDKDVKITANAAAANANLTGTSEALLLSGHKKITDYVSSESIRQNKPLTNNLKLVLFIFWSIIFLFLITKLLLGLYGAHRLTRQGEKLASFSWRRLIEKVITTLRLKRNIQLLRHSLIKSPLTWGMIKPVIIMPDEAQNWTREQCYSALFHEMSHIKRGDFLVRIIARISCAVFWFNPLVWLVYKTMKNEQEKACDEYVIRAGVLPSTYASNLLSIRRTGQPKWNPPAAALGALGENQLTERLNAILKKQFNPKEIKMKTKIMLSMTVILLIVIVGLARPAKSIAADDTAIGIEETSAYLTQTAWQEKTTVKQEKEQKKKSEEAEKKEKAKKKKNTWVTKEGKTIVFIDEDGKKKKIVLDGDKKSYFIKKGEKGVWTIAEDELKHLKGKHAKVIKLKDGKTIWISAKDAHLKEGSIAVTSPKFHIYMDKENLEKDKNVLYVSHHGADTIDIHLDSEKHKELNEKIKAIQEKLQKITENEAAEETAEVETQTLKEVEEVLAKIAEEIAAKEDKLKNVYVSYHPKTAVVKEHQGELHEHDVELHEEHEELHEKDYVVVGVAHKDNSIRIKFTADKDTDLAAKKEEIMEKLKAELPEGYKIDMFIDEEQNTLKITIKGDSANEEETLPVKELVKKISKIFKKQ